LKISVIRENIVRTGSRQSKLFWGSTGIALLCLSIAAAAEEAERPGKMQLGGKWVDGTIVGGPSHVIQQFPGDLPAALGQVANNTNWEIASATRSVKDVQIYRAISPSVVLILTKDGLGSGSLIGADGTILTNYHVVRGYDTVVVVYKPTSEGKQPTRDEIKQGQVVKIDEIADLALVKAFDVPSGRVPIRPRRVGDILKHVPSDKKVNSRFRYFT
jgi:S1-C subfamily serine protease